MIRKLFLILTYLTFSITCLQAQKTGNATYYSHRLHGHRTSDGGRYHKDSLTCAHRTYPLGTLLKVKNPKNGKTVVVRVTDRGPYSRRFMIDLSYRAAKELDIVSNGYALVEISETDSIEIPYKPPKEVIKTCFEPAIIEPEPVSLIKKRNK
jgi:rare lipoprotein A